MLMPRSVMLMGAALFIAGCSANQSREIMRVDSFPGKTLQSSPYEVTTYAWLRGISRADIHAIEGTPRQDLGSLAEEVNASLKEGWQPHGAPFIHVSGAAVICCQAIVNFHQPTSAETIAKLRRAAASAFRRGRTS